MKRALAIFAKTPVPGHVKTRLTPPLSAREGAELYRCMLKDTVSRVATLGIDTFLCYDGDRTFFEKEFPGIPLLAQEGEHLGKRLENCFSHLMSLGYRGRTVIGTDAPDLPVRYIADAFRLVDTGSDVVFGPAEDGGYYLVALSGGYADLFRDIPWSGSSVLEVSMERARSSALSAGLLPPWYDVDGYDDLYRPGLSDPSNGAPLTRSFIGSLGIASLSAANAC